MPSSAPRIRVILGTLLCLVVACSAPPPVATPLVFDGELPFDPGPDVGGTALMTEIFADGEVTFDEYERAFSAGVQCIRDEGFEVEGPLRYPDGYLIISPGWDPNHILTYRVLAGTDERDADGEISGRCQAQWYHAVESMYLRQFEPTEADIREWLERAWACAEEKGLPVSQPPTESEAMDAVSQGCEPWTDG